MNDFKQKLIDYLLAEKSMGKSLSTTAFLPDGPTISPSNNIFIFYCCDFIIPRSVKI